MRILSSVVVRNYDWKCKLVYGGYTSIAIVSAISISYFVTHYGNEEVKKSVRTIRSVSRDDYSMLGLFWKDRKIMYMVPLCVAFPLVSSFITSFVDERAFLLHLGKKKQ